MSALEVRHHVLVVATTLALFVAGGFCLGWLMRGMDYQPPARPDTAAVVARALGQLDGYVCGPWQPTGQSCPGGCYWRRTCYDEDGSFTQTSCRPQAGAYCPLSDPGAGYGPANAPLDSWATSAWGGAWDSMQRDWVRDGQTLQDWVGEGVH